MQREHNSLLMMLLIVVIWGSFWPVSTDAYSGLSESEKGSVSASITTANSKFISKGMAYTDLQKQLIATGWLPLRSPQCWSNVGSEAEICNQRPEVQSCNTNNQCTMRFANKEQSEQIRITTRRRETGNQRGQIHYSTK